VITSTATPSYVILDSKDIVKTLRSDLIHFSRNSFIEFDLRETITQALEAIMNCEDESAIPYINHGLLKGNYFQNSFLLQQQFQSFFVSLIYILLNLELIYKFEGGYMSDYCFHDLRGDSIILRHLSNI
jgi:hypothetical protein